MCRGLDSRTGVICGLSLLLILFLASTGFSPVLRFSPLLKNQHFQIPIRSGIVKHFIMSLWLRGLRKHSLCLTLICIYIYIFILFLWTLKTVVFGLQTNKSDFPESTVHNICPSTLWALFLSFAVQIYPCDSKPCQNGATCNNDANDISKYKCQCRDWFTGINCEGNQLKKQNML